MKLNRREFLGLFTKTAAVALVTPKVIAEFTPIHKPVVIGFDPAEGKDYTMIDVRQFGAVGDGIADDTEAFQQALTWVE